MSFLLRGPPKLIRSNRPIVRITETLSKSSINNATTTDPGKERDGSTNAVVLDARDAKCLSDLTWLYKAAQKHSGSAAFRKPGGRVVILRASSLSSSSLNNPETVAVQEAIVGFAKSLAKENGTRGATVNLLCDETGAKISKDDACTGPLDWLLSCESAYVTGQEMRITKLAATAYDSAECKGGILVTGAAGAIGKATAEYFANNDPTTEASNLLLVDHPSTENKLDQIASKLSDKSVDILPLDLTQEGASDTLAKEGTRLGGLKRIIHAAGITRDKTLIKMEYESSWLPVLQVNLQAAINIDKVLLDTPGALCPSNSSSFVYFSSTSGINGNAGQSNYAASKSGLLGYAVAMGHNHPQHNFRVVSPGFIATDMTAKMPWLVRMIGSRLNALGQAGTPEDIAAAVAFLSSREASGLAPGMNLRVCGMFMGGR